MVAVAACLLGYGEVGLWLQSEAQREGSEIILEENPYKPWVMVSTQSSMLAMAKKSSLDCPGICRK